MENTLDTLGVTSKTVNSISDALSVNIYIALQDDTSREVMGLVSKLLSKHDDQNRRRNVNIHSDQCIVETTLLRKLSKDCVHINMHEK